MKRISLTSLFIFCMLCSFAQTEAQKFKESVLSKKNSFPYANPLNKELKSELIGNDFSHLFTHTDNSIVYGFIGNNYQRIRIKLIAITKDKSIADIYHVYGKSMVKSNVDEFNGTIQITNIKKFKKQLHGCEDEYKYKGYKGEFVLLADYSFQENPRQNHSGVFTGSLCSAFFITKENAIRYNDIEDCADGYTNNQFVGQWASYDKKLIQRCNWGDFRIPNSGKLDIGAGEFSPDDPYLKYGWQSIRDMFAQGADHDKAKAIENAKWWE